MSPKKTISAKVAIREQLVEYPDGVQRPKTRGECARGIRPCPFVSCAHHLYLDVTNTGSLTLNFPDIEPHQMKVSCALDAADEGPATLEEIGANMNLCREAARKLELRIMDVNKKELRRLRIYAED